MHYVICLYMLFSVIVHHVQMLLENFKAVGPKSNGQMWQEMKESDVRDKCQLHSRAIPFMLVPFPKCDHEKGLWFGFMQSPLNLTRSELTDSNIHETSHLVPPALHKSLTVPVSCGSANGCHLEVYSSSLYAKMQHFPCRKATTFQLKCPNTSSLKKNSHSSRFDRSGDKSITLFFSNLYTINPIF